MLDPANHEAPPMLKTAQEMLDEQPLRLGLAAYFTGKYEEAEQQLGAYVGNHGRKVALAYFFRGAAHASRYFLSGETFGAAEAHRLGLVHMVSNLDDIGATAAQIVSELLAGKREAQRAAKLLIDDVRLAALNESLIEQTARRLAELRGKPEAQEAIAEYLNR